MTLLSGDKLDPSTFFGISAAFAADGIVRNTIDNVPYDIWLWVLGLSIAGWFVSNASALIGWVEGEGLVRTRARLNIIGSLVASLLAGISAILLGTQAGTSDIVNLLGVIGASFAGGEWIRRVLVVRSDTLGNSK